MKKLSNILFLIILCYSFILSNQLKLNKNQKEKQNNETEYLPNSNFMYRGYDIFYADFLSEGNIDPGFRKNIFEASYNNEEKTSDRRYFIPDGFSVSRSERCSLEVSSTTITGEESYMKSFENELSVSGTIKGVTFSASTTFNQVSEDTTKNHKAFIYSKSECSVYTGEIDNYDSPNLHRSFKKAIENLSKLDFNQNKDDYWNFISSFGTHFITYVKMGAKYGAVSRTTQEEIGKMRSQGIGIETGIGFKDIIEIKNKSKFETKSTSNLLTRMEDVKIFSIGSRPSDDLTESKWANQVFSQPMPISYKLASILDIFDERKIMIDKNQFKNIEDINFLKNNLKEAYDNYCNSYLLPHNKVKSCDEIKKDAIIEIQKNDIIKSDKQYYLQNFATGTCLTFTGNFNRVLAISCEHKRDQDIFFTHTYYGGSPGWVIKPNPGSQSCFEGNIIRPCGWNRDDLFDLILNDDKTYTIRMQYDQKCVEVKEANKADNADVQLNHCNKLPEQKWRAILVEYIHIVKSGDGLFSIAEKYNTTFEEIMRLNPQITNPNLLLGGQKIRYK